MEQTDGTRQDGLRGWRDVAERAVRPDGIVVPTPVFDQDLRLLQRVEDLAVEQFIAQLAVEALAVTVLSR